MKEINLSKCKECQNNFSLFDVEISFLSEISPIFLKKKYPLPTPTLCPSCREQNRLAFRNEWRMYQRTCDATEKSLISIYPQESPYTVIDQKEWWSDSYNPLEYGRKFDFSRPFFEQFHELNLAVPKVSIQNAKSENAFYTNYSWGNKNCYLAVGCSECEDCYYCYRVTKSRNVSDSYDLTRSELCYECTQGSDLYRCLFSQNCHNSSELILCTDCRGCSNCYKCSGLRNAKFYIENTQYCEKEYLARMQDIQQQISQSTSFLVKMRSEKESTTSLINCEDCSGDFLKNCSRCHFVFSFKDSQDCLYCGTGESNHDLIDCNFSDKNELQYYSTNLTQNYRVLFCALVWFTKNSLYLTNCFHSSNLFGCTGMKHNNFCILNKQYTENDYNQTCAKIVEHMQETGEWGRFFPSTISPFPYNCSTAFEYYPMSKETALSKGLRWEDDYDRNKHGEPKQQKEVRVCTASGKAFRVTSKELQLYDTLSLSSPNTCPEVRHWERMQGVKRAICHYI